MLSWTDWIARMNSVMIPRYWCLYDVLLKSTWFLVADSPEFPREGTFSAAHERIVFLNSLQRQQTSGMHFLCSDFALQCRTTELWDQETIETMAMMATWCVMCGLFAGQIHAKAMDNEISHSDEGASFAPILLTDQSDGDQEPGRIGWTLVISFMFCIYSSPIPFF